MTKNPYTKQKKICVYFVNTYISIKAVISLEIEEVGGGMNNKK